MRGLGRYTESRSRAEVPQLGVVLPVRVSDAIQESTRRLHQDLSARKHGIHVDPFFGRVRREPDGPMFTAGMPAWLNLSAGIVRRSTFNTQRSAWVDQPVPPSMTAQLKRGGADQIV